MLFARSEALLAEVREIGLEMLGRLPKSYRTFAEETAAGWRAA